MRHVMAVALLCLSASSLAAQKRFIEPFPLAGPTASHVDLFRAAHLPRAAVVTEKSDSALIFAVVGNANGGGGTYFRSEVMLTNNSQRDQEVTIFYFPAGAGNCSALASKKYTIPAYSWYVWTDFVGEVFETTGLGSLVVFATNGRGDLDTTGKIDGVSRIWTPVAGFTGTSSQSFPAVALSFFSGPQTAYGARQDSGYRTNVVIFNYNPTGSTAARVFDIGAIGISGQRNMTMTVPPCSMALAALPVGTLGPMSVTFTPRDTAGAWYGFTSSVDNASGDSWSSAARPD